MFHGCRLGAGDLNNCFTGWKQVSDAFRAIVHGAIFQKRPLKGAGMKTISPQMLSTDEKFAADTNHNYALAHWRQCEPERELLAAVLADAVRSYKKRCGCSDARFKEAQSWIFGKDSNRLFAFETVCAILGVSAQRVRQSSPVTDIPHQ